jgi:hypothetical protein
MDQVLRADLIRAHLQVHHVIVVTAVQGHQETTAVLLEIRGQVGRMEDPQGAKV